MKITEICFLNNIPVDDDTKKIYKLEDGNKVFPLFGWEPWTTLHRDDHCCEKMFNYLQKKESWIQYISYDKTYGLPYHSFFSKKQLLKLWKYPKEMQQLNFCPFCGMCLNNEEIYELRIKKMDKYYEDHKKENESWIDFWIRLRHTKEGKSFFSDHWRK
jgi:ABC-type ATPase with predicted acetyltransferase domain